MRKVWLMRYVGIVFVCMAFLSIPHIPGPLGFEESSNAVVVVGAATLLTWVSKYLKLFGVVFGIGFASLGIFGVANPEFGDLGTLALGCIVLLATMGGEELRHGGEDKTPKGYIVFFYGVPLALMLFALLAWTAHAAMWFIGLFIAVGLLIPLYMALFNPPEEYYKKKTPKAT